MKDAKYNSKYPKILFYYDTDHNKSLFGKISEKLANTTLINKHNIENIKRTPCKCDKIIQNIENDYSKYIQYKYNTSKNSLRVSLKKWQRLGASEKSYQRRYRKYKIKKEFEKWVTFFRLSDCDIVAAWCPIKPKRRIVFEAALICNKSLLYFEDSPIPGYIICDHKGINDGLSLKKDILSTPYKSKILTPISLKKMKPIKYPSIAPKTEPIVAINAILNHSFFFAKVIGIIKTSGGIGNTKLSMKEIKPRILFEFLCPAKFKVLL